MTIDEQALRAAFDTVEAPETLEARWRAKVALAPDDDGPDVPVAAPIPEPRPAPRPWRRILAAAVAATAVGGGLVGAITANRAPSPDPDQIILTTTNPPTTSASQSQVSSPATVSSVPGTPGAASGTPGGPGAGPPVPGAGPAGAAGPATPGQAIAPARGPLTEWPDATNTGPAGTQLQLRNGDLRISEPRAIYADLRVNGTVYVDAPDVTLRRVMVVPSGDVGVVQGPRAQRLRIEDSQVTNMGRSVQYGVRQEATGLVVHRSDITANIAAVLAASDATIVDSYLSDVRTTGNTSRITVRHNTIGTTIALLDRDGPVTGVTIEGNRIGGSAPAARIYAPSSTTSHHIQVTGNQFRRDATTTPAACSGWNAQAPGNIWAGNVWSDTNAPANP